MHLVDIEDAVLREGLARQEEALSAGIAIRSLGDRDQRHVSDAEIGQYLLHDRQLTFAAVDQSFDGAASSGSSCPDRKTGGATTSAHCPAGGAGSR